MRATSPTSPRADTAAAQAGPSSATAGAAEAQQEPPAERDAPLARRGRPAAGVAASARGRPRVDAGALAGAAGAHHATAVRLQMARDLLRNQLQAQPPGGATDAASARQLAKLAQTVMQAADDLPDDVRRPLLKDAARALVECQAAWSNFEASNVEYATAVRSVKQAVGADGTTEQKMRVLAALAPHMRASNDAIQQSVVGLKRGIDKGLAPAEAAWFGAQLNGLRWRSVERCAGVLFSTMEGAREDWLAEHVFGDMEGALVEQRERLSMAVESLAAFQRHAKDRMWHHGLSAGVAQVLEDLQSMTIDLMSMAIEAEVASAAQTATPAPDVEESARQWLQQLIIDGRTIVASVREVLDNAARAPDQQAQTGTSAAQTFVAVAGPMGLTVAAETRPDGSAEAFEGGKKVRYEKVGDDYEPQEPAELDVESVSDISLDETSPLQRQSARLLKSAQKSLDERALRMPDMSPAALAETNPNTLGADCARTAREGRRSMARMQRLAEQQREMSQREGLSPAQQQEHEQVAIALERKLSALQSQVQRLEQPGLRLSMIKSYVRPQTAQWAELHRAGELTGRSPLTPLASDSEGTLFECALRPRPDAEAPDPAPVWVHLHTKRSMTVEEVLQAAPEEDFVAVHLKSDIEKDRGANWVQVQRENGIHDAVVHRSRVPPELLPAFLGLALVD